jgi:hypothetical protein
VTDPVKRGVVFNHREITPGPWTMNATPHPQNVKPVIRVSEEEPIIMIDSDPETSHALPNPVKHVGREVVPASFAVLVCKNCNKYPLDHFEVAMFPHMSEGWCSLKCWQACLARKCCG